MTQQTTPSLQAARPPHPVLSPAAATPHAFVQAMRAVSVGALLALIVLGLAWELWLASTGSGWLALKVIPLFFPLAGLLRHRLYTYRWVSLLVWLYFTEGIVRATGLPTGVEADLGVVLAWIEVGLCLVLFSACTANVRWRLKHPLTATGASA